MRKPNFPLLVIIAFSFIFCFSCDKESNSIIDNTPIPPPPVSNNFNEPLSEFVYAQNYILEVVNIMEQVVLMSTRSEELHLLF